MEPLLFLIWKLDLDGSPMCYFSSFSGKTSGLGQLYYFISELLLLLFWLSLHTIDECIWLFFWDLAFLLDPANDETCLIVSFSYEMIFFLVFLSSFITYSAAS